MAKKRLGKVHCIIPDVQVRPDVKTDHLTHIGNYLAEKRPDVIVQIGDFGDIPSLNYHAKNEELEGKRVLEDIEATREAMRKLVAPFRKIKGYNPKMILTLGNHEQRLDRVDEDLPKFKGLISSKSLKYEEHGWKVIPFLEVATIHGIEYCHYFVSGARCNPISSAVALLRERQMSAVQGHVQYTDMAIHKKTGHIGLLCGICYTHDEKYLTPQGNSTRRQIIMLHEVHNGIFDPMFVSLRFLRNNYS